MGRVELMRGWQLKLKVAKTREDKEREVNRGSLLDFLNDMA